MMRSLFAGVSGLRNHQLIMDVIGNNIANVNTIGFKSSRVTFSDLLNQTLRGASSSQQSSGGAGGTNPLQVGLGVMTATIDTMFAQGNLQSTGRITDLAIQGKGFFSLSDGTSKYYTRAGAFDVDTNGNLVSPSNGYLVQGKNATAGVISSASQVTDVKIPFGITVDAQATSKVSYVGNLDSDTATAGTHVTSMTVYDSLGSPVSQKITFTRAAPALTWNYDIDLTAADGTNIPITGGKTGTLVFNSDGSLNSTDASYSVPAVVTGTLADGASPLTVALNMGTDNKTDGLTMYAASSEAAGRTQNGYASGVLKTFVVDTEGTITGMFSNGQSQTLARLSLASFNNEGGLNKRGENLYSESNNSGRAVLGEAGSGGLGTISPSSLEMSNVDLAQEFTNMILAERGFQANARIISTTDEMLQDLVNLKR